MVEMGNHQGRPPGGQQLLSEMTSELSPAVSLSSSLQDHWINKDIASLEFLDSLCSSNGDQANSPDSLDTACCNITKDCASAFRDLEFEKLYMIQPSEAYHRSSCLPLWGFPMDVDTLKVDDVFQVDQSDLVLSPTLAELNADNETNFDLEFGNFHFDFFTDAKKEVPLKNTPIKEDTSKATIVLDKSSNDNTVVLKTGQTIKKETADEEGFKDLEDGYPVVRGKVARSFKDEDDYDVENDYPVVKAKVACSSPLAIPGASVRSRRRTYTSTSVTSSLSSNDEGFGSQAEDTDCETHVASDAESLACDEESQEGSASSSVGPHWFGAASSKSSFKGLKPGSRKKRYFWQYNIQSKGPKGPRIAMNNAYSLDPHVLNDATDPVFSSECHLEGVKHAGKARRGDGNDLTPNPRKLHNIGAELKMLNKMINDLTPACEASGGGKPKSRKEKNKLASRSCRLKKKAQHEANKLKLYGLQQEHTHLLNLVGDAKGLLQEMKAKNVTSKLYFQNLQKFLDRRDLRPVAGHTAEFVNSILDKVAAGQPLPGLEDV